MQQEYNRLVTFLVLEEHRNRELPPLEIADTAEEYNRRLHQALNYVVEFLRDDEILTVPDWLDPADYSDPNEPPEPLPSSPSIDHKAREREILPGETHEFIGHLFDDQRRELDERPIRGAGRRFNMEWMRMEGWAVALEELMMQAGVLDDRPRRGREVQYLMNISHMSLALPDLKMHNNEITFDESRQLCADLMAKGWSQKDEPMVWYNLLSWRHSGFSVHGAVRARDRLSAARLGRYMIRCPLALKRLSWNEDNAEVRYTARPSRRSGPRPATACWDVLEFIARVVDHIPEPSQRMTRYWGWYANAVRGKRRKVDEEEPASTRPTPEDTCRRLQPPQSRLSWAKLIKRVYEVDPLLCPFCGADMRVLTFITDFATARAIRRSLKLPAQEPEPLAHGPPHELELLDQTA